MAQLRWKGIRTVRSQGIQQTSHKRFIGREINHEGGCHCKARNSRELSRRQGLYSFSWGMQWGRAFKSEASKDRDWWNFKYRAWAFYSVGWGQVKAIRAGRILYGWSWQLDPQGRGLDTHVPWGDLLCFFLSFSSSLLLRCLLPAPSHDHLFFSSCCLPHTFSWTSTLRIFSAAATEMMAATCWWSLPFPALPMSTVTSSTSCWLTSTHQNCLIRHQNSPWVQEI